MSYLQNRVKVILSCFQFSAPIILSFFGKSQWQFTQYLGDPWCMSRYFPRTMVCSRLWTFYIPHLSCFPCQAKNLRYGLIEKSYLWAKRIQLHLFLPKTKVSFFWRSKDISKCLELQNFLTIYNLEYRSQRTRTICYSSKRILHSYRRRTQWQEWLLPCSKYLDPFSWCFHDKFLFASCFIRKEWLCQSVKSNEFSQCSYCELLDL